MRYFKKEIFANPLYLPNGAKVPFELVGTNTGVLATEDTGLLAELDKAIKKHIGGVVELTEAESQELKKNPPVSHSRAPLFVPQMLGKPPLPGSIPKVPAVAKAQVQSEPMGVPDTIPLTAKVKSMRKAVVNVAPSFATA